MKKTVPIIKQQEKNVWKPKEKLPLESEPLNQNISSSSGLTEAEKGTIPINLRTHTPPQPSSEKRRLFKEKLHETLEKSASKAKKSSNPPKQHAVSASVIKLSSRFDVLSDKFEEPAELGNKEGAKKDYNSQEGSDSDSIGSDSYCNMDYTGIIEDNQDSWNLKLMVWKPMDDGLENYRRADEGTEVLRLSVSDGEGKKG
ncbi:OLC1v1035882C1 [Oldenlandia corymbosa var. corymbosa]|uniref:OLC1v1035882C1 n=1 Tax=Oldenlandia corymbosa var. corymbosa TaxID=529605 RepID=A0AAV1CV52_OLDCO|nr:OLC1v1035882C1 [Oldenlandia corymbosa var. corymbosa]